MLKREREREREMVVCKVHGLRENISDIPSIACVESRNSLAQFHHSYERKVKRHAL